MKNSLAILILCASLAPAMPAGAEERTVVLHVHHADCVLCGPIVKRTLERVSGVKAVVVSQTNAMADVTATVTFEAAQANARQLIAATTRAGYPADLRQ